MLTLLLLLALTAAQDVQDGREPVKVGGSIKEPKKLKNVPPEYPDDALKAELQGVVVLQCNIDTQGRVANMDVLTGPVPLQEAAIKAVRKWRYSPTLLNGQAVPVIMTVTVNFRHSGHVRLDELIDSLGHKDEYIREAAAQTLGHLGRQAVKSVPALQRAVDDENECGRRPARRSSPCKASRAVFGEVRPQNKRVQPDEAGASDGASQLIPVVLRRRQPSVLPEEMS